MAKKTTAPKAPAPKPKPAPEASKPADSKHLDQEALEKGYFGYSPDPTPRENYTLRTPSDAPTPETDKELAEKARKNREAR